ncbi:MAG TPA: response regulator transcription factor [Candidatus Dormibacteraeota bacterium]|nr:response regulator transcription factor [Candidatus Dormibacteraeota bacterium]
MTGRNRILVVDDDQKIAGTIRRALVFEGYEVDVANDGVSALRQMREQAPDLVILDVMMPAMDGVEVCRRIRAEGATPVLMVTAKDTTEDRVLGLDSGADDYVVKPFSYDELQARVRALLRRSGPQQQSMLRYADLGLDLLTREVTRGDRQVELTVKEFELLTYLMRNPRQVLTRGKILDAVWGYDFGAASNAVDVYIGYLRRKLESGGEPRLIQTVVGVGYALRER